MHQLTRNNPPSYFGTRVSIIDTSSSESSTQPISRPAPMVTPPEEAYAPPPSHGIPPSNLNPYGVFESVSEKESVSPFEEPGSEFVDGGSPSHLEVPPQLAPEVKTDPARQIARILSDAITSASDEFDSDFSSEASGSQEFGSGSGNSNGGGSNTSSSSRSRYESASFSGSGSS